MQGQDGERLVTLDGLRGIAAIAVMLYHIGNFYHFPSPFARGYLFVDFFFLLSGFVLARSIEPRFARGWTTWAFMKARVVRLWPVIAIGAVAGALPFGLRFGWHDVPVYLALALALLPLLRPWSTIEIFPLNPPQWSLMFELIANLVHGLVLRRLKGGPLLALALVFAAYLLLCNFIQGSNSRGPDAATWIFGLPRVGFAYTFGVWMGRLHAGGKCRLPAPRPVAILLPLAAMTIASLFQQRTWLVDSLVVLVAFPASLWIAACTPARGWAPWLAQVGALSFPLYAVHLPIIICFAGVSHSMISAAGAVTASFIAAHLVSRSIERRQTRRAVRSIPGNSVAASPR